MVGFLPRLFACGVLCLLLGGIASSAPGKLQQRGEFSFEVADAPAWVQHAEVAANWDKDAPGASGERLRSWLLDTQIARFGGRRWRYFDYANEAVSAEMLGELGKIQLDFNPDFQRLIIHQLALRRDGVWQDRLDPERVTLARREAEFERDMATGTVTAMIVLNDVRLGDVVRVRFSIDGENPIMAGLDSDGGQFAWSSPVLQRNLRILFDPGAMPAEYRANGIAPATVRKTAEYLEWRYSAHAMAPVREEDGYPEWYRAYPQVIASEKRSWRDVAEWARRLYPTPAPLPADLNQRIEQWQKLPDVESRVSAALLAVQDEVRYFGVEIGDNTHRPTEPATVWTQRRGDCKDKSRLLATILGQMQIEAYPALVSAQRRKAIADVPPTASAFDHVIVQVRSKDGIWWLDPTRTQQRGPASAQDISDFGVALPVAADSKGLVEVSRNPGFVDKSNVVEKFAPDADGGGADLLVRSEYLGGAANRTRYQTQTSGVDGMSRQLAEYYRRRYGEVEVQQPLQIEDDPGVNRVVITETYRLNKPWAASTVSERALDLSSDVIATRVALPEILDRHAPLAVKFPEQSTHRIELTLPSGWRWKGTPAQRELVNAAGEYHYSSGSSGNTVYSDENYSARLASVPTEAIADNLRWRRDVHEQTYQRWAIALPAAEAAQARKTRLNDLIRGVMDDNAKSQKDRNRD